MTLGRADWFMPSFYHSVLLQLPHAVGPKGQGAVSHVRLQLAYCEVSTSQGRRPTGHPQLQYRNPRIRRAGGCADRSLCSSGTELAFDKELRSARIGLFGLKVKTIEHTTAIFRQINKSEPRTHHDALEFPDGHIELLTDLSEGQTATVLQLPAQPATPAEAQLRKGSCTSANRAPYRRVQAALPKGGLSDDVSCMSCSIGRTTMQRAVYELDAAERPRVSRETLKDSPRAKGSCGRWWSTL